MKLLCFDIGGTNIKYGVIENGNILEKSMFPTNYKRGHKDVTDRLIATAKKVQKKHLYVLFYNLLGTYFFLGYFHFLLPHI